MTMHHQDPLAPHAPPPARLDAPTAEALLRLTRMMVAAAEADEWERVARHDAARRDLLDGVPAESPAPLSEELVSALRAADRSVLERARRTRAALGEETHQVRAERDARDSYASIMRGDQGGDRHA